MLKRLAISPKIGEKASYLGLIKHGNSRKLAARIADVDMSNEGV